MTLRPGGANSSPSIPIANLLKGPCAPRAVLGFLFLEAAFPRAAARFEPRHGTHALPGILFSPFHAAPTLNLAPNLPLPVPVLRNPGILPRAGVHPNRPRKLTVSSPVPEV